MDNISTYQDGNVCFAQITTCVCLRKGFDAIVRILESALHTLSIPIPDQPLTHIRALAIEAKERARWDIDEKLCSVLGYRLPERIKKRRWTRQLD